MLAGKTVAPSLQHAKEPALTDIRFHRPLGKIGETETGEDLGDRFRRDDQGLARRAFA